MNRVLCAAVAVLCVLVFPSPGITQQNSRPNEDRLHEDAACGFRVTHPATWQESWFTPEGKKDAQFRIFPPNVPDSYVVITGIWDVSAIGMYPASGASGDRSSGEDARALGTLAEVLLNGGKLPGELVWFDQFRSGPIVASYLMQSQETRENGSMYHLTFLLVSSGAARGLTVDGWSYSVVGAWIPQTKYGDIGPRVMDIVKSIEFIKTDKACWT